MKTIFINGSNFKIFVELIVNMTNTDPKVMIRLTDENLLLIAFNYQTQKKVQHVLNNGFYETIYQEPVDELETQVDTDAFGEILVDINNFVTHVSDFVDILSEGDPENGVHLTISGRQLEVSLVITDPEHYYYADTATVIFNP